MESRHGTSPASAKAAAQKHVLSEVSSIAVFAAGLFALAAIWTYHPADPSFFTNVRGPVHNACGRVGAYLASGLLQYFGLGAFLIPAALGFVSATLHRREGAVRLIATLGGMSVAVLSLTVFLTLQWKYWPYAGNLMLTGGALGVWVAEVLIRQFNALGSALVSLAVFFLAVALSTPVSVARVGGGAIRFVAVLLWKVTQVAVAYLAYLVGLLIARLARAAGDGIQAAIEGAVERAKFRREAAKEARRLAAARPMALKEPAIGLETEERDEIDISALSPAGPQLPLPAPVLGAALHSEAPNALPELEDAPAPFAARSHAPAILPPETAGLAPAIEDDSVSAKVSRRLARAASRLNKRGQWKLPTVEFLRKPPKVESSDRSRAPDRRTRRSSSRSSLDFGIEGEVTAVRPGPVITLYEFKPGPGVKVSRIAALADDLSMALSAQSVRILAPLPGKSVVGIEIPSESRETVYMREFLQHPDFYGQKHAIPIVMGKDIGGQTYSLGSGAHAASSLRRPDGLRQIGFHERADLLAALSFHAG